MLIGTLVLLSFFAFAQQKDTLQNFVFKIANQFVTTLKDTFPVEHNIEVDTVIVANKTIDIVFNKDLSYIPIRETNCQTMYSDLKARLGNSLSDYKLVIYCGRHRIEDLIPNIYRSSTKLDKMRLPAKTKTIMPLVSNLSKLNPISNGLQNRHLALWHSHGWYYEKSLDRWEWQRARILQTVEDLYTMSYTLPYLVPMLENAGAIVLMPRERDTQLNEVIIDNDSPIDSCFIEKTNIGNAWQTGTDKGFAIGKPPYSEGVNPFKLGTYKQIATNKITTAETNWIPEIPAEGSYAVYVSYQSVANSTTDARYTVFHKGGKTEFSVNQQISGGTWVYLGTFIFDKGSNPETGKVVLTNLSIKTGSILTADAVRFGGGMGNISRNGKISQRARYLEAARYNMQYSGVPDTFVYNLHSDNDDIVDDYQGRGEWVAYLKGAPCGPTKNRNLKGLGIPVDLSLAFHTDAGMTYNEKTIGTLVIFDSEADQAMFPDGTSRLASRDFADVLQSKIVSDIRSKYDADWNRRGLWNKPYSEAYRANVPAALLELLSHQNFADMQLGQNPQFRFDVSRAIYKSILQYIAFQNGYEFIVQPLPVSHFSAELSGNQQVTLKWRPVNDTLETTAKPEQFIVYTKIGDSGFDSGVLTNQTQITFDNLKIGVIYSYRITAVNSGGESFPSETLSVCTSGKAAKPVLIINAFDRVAAPASFQSGQYAGFMNVWDEGVPDCYDLHYTGAQYDFNLKSEWLDDDSPGFGAGFADCETMIIAGNTHNFPALHGQAIAAAGYSFVSASDEAVTDKTIDIMKYKIIDLIMGEERETYYSTDSSRTDYKTFTPEMQKQLKTFCDANGNVFVSGSYIATDMHVGKPTDHADIKFINEILHYSWRTNHAAKTGLVKMIDKQFQNAVDEFRFCTDFNPNIYKVEAPDAIEPSGDNSKVLMRYSENNVSAGIIYNGNYKVVAMGFPFETIIDSQTRNALMKRVLEFFAE